MGDLDGRVALVTGAGSGLGREIALAFARAGARVAANDVRLESAREVQDALRGQGACVTDHPLVFDVADSAAVRAAFDTIARATGDRLDILVNNAGYAETDPESVARMQQVLGEAATGGPIRTGLDSTERMSDERWSRMLAVHLNGAFYCTRAALALMRPRRYGRIINMASIGATTGIAGVPHYSAAKAGIVGLTRSVAREVGVHGILVNAIAPGYIETPLLAAFGTPQQQAATKTFLALQTVVGRLGEPSEVAATALFLAGPGGSYFTGQVLSPNGGFVI